MAVIQAVLLYGSETWVTTPCIEKYLGGFHHRVVCRLMGRQPLRVIDGRWRYFLTEEAMKEVGFQEVDKYVSLFHNTFTQVIVTRFIMFLCLVVEMRPGLWVYKQWC